MAGRAHEMVAADARAGTEAPGRGQTAEAKCTDAVAKPQSAGVPFSVIREAEGHLKASRPDPEPLEDRHGTDRFRPARDDRGPAAGHPGPHGPAAVVALRVHDRRAGARRDRG